MLTIYMYMYILQNSVRSLSLSSPHPVCVCVYMCAQRSEDNCSEVVQAFHLVETEPLVLFYRSAAYVLQAI